MIPEGTIQQEKPGVWKIHVNYFHPGRVSEDEFPSRETAAEAYRTGNWK